MNIIEATRESLRVGRGMSRPMLYADTAAFLYPTRDTYVISSEITQQRIYCPTTADILAEDWFVRGADTTTLRPSEVDNGQA